MTLYTSSCKLSLADCESDMIYDGTCFWAADGGFKSHILHEYGYGTTFPRVNMDGYILRFNELAYMYL